MWTGGMEEYKINSIQIQNIDIDGYLTKWCVCALRNDV